MAEVNGFCAVSEAHRLIQVVAEQVRAKLEEIIGQQFSCYEAMSFCNRYNDMMKEDCIKIKVGDDAAIMVYVEEAAVMTFPPQVNLLSYIPNVPLDADLSNYIEQLMALRK